MIFQMEKTVKTNFTIEHILNCAGEKKQDNNNIPSTSSQTVEFYDPYAWLQCTRYCPPKIPRVQKNRSHIQKRQLGRHPRIPFTPHQLAVLEEKFHQTPYLSSEEVIELAKKLQLADVRVKIWFQNRRARERREKCANTTCLLQQNDKKLQETKEENT